VYEQSHGVLIDDDALQAAATLSERYLSGRQLPDKAIDVLDTACARVAINLLAAETNLGADHPVPQCEAEIRQLEREIRIGLRTDTERLEEVRAQYETAQTELLALKEAWRQQQVLVQEIIALRKGLLEEAEARQKRKKPCRKGFGYHHDDDLVEEMCQKPNPSPAERLSQLTAELNALHNAQLLVSPHVDKKQIAAVIAEWTGVPLKRLSQNEMSVITDLPQWLGDTIKGQDLAIQHLHKHLLTARADLRRADRWAHFCWPTEWCGQNRNRAATGGAALRRPSVSHHHQYVGVPGKAYCFAADWFPARLCRLWRRRRADRSDSSEAVFRGTAR
jgi:type VI secretion system protein VasG